MSNRGNQEGTHPTEEGDSTSRGLGMEFPGAKRLMDEMEIQSESGKGTKMTARR